MRRAPIVVTATVLGTAGVLLFKPLPVSSLDGTTTAAAAGSTSTGSTSSEATSGSTSTGSTDSSSAAALAPSATPSASAKQSTGTTTTTGALETDRYGDTQVKVTIKDGKITEVTVLAYNSDDPRSAQISEAAIPTLRQEVLSTQTAAVDTVSGATYTSNAYAASLQAALDEAGFVAADGSKANTDLASADANIRGGGH